MADQYDNFYMYDPEYLFSLYSSQSANQIFCSNQTQLETSSLTNETDSSPKSDSNEQQDTQCKNDPERRIRWTKDEHRLFELALVKHGRNKHKLIQQDIKTKTVDQCISHSQKFFVKLDNLFERGTKEPVSEKIQRQIKTCFQARFYNFQQYQKFKWHQDFTTYLKPKQMKLWLTLMQNTWNQKGYDTYFSLLFFNTDFKFINIIYVIVVLLIQLTHNLQIYYHYNITLPYICHLHTRGLGMQLPLVRELTLISENATPF
ncbi:Myb-like_DNA-binding domain-containing protein [Hexamita inflata]|uniref:Myb-like DNA-binding domain-containing protein n=1 Tax=Hexamita inflata TaxID=28002 RepID=A0AA86QNW7_9EUKA|nr:Myb-like DNA-binding domain-containing protein [Hexamita inflata]